MKRGLGDKARLQHIEEAILEIEKYTFGLVFEEFSNDSKTYFATIKQLEIIGEAANHLDPVLLKQYDSVNWKAIIRFRSILVHHYFVVKLERVWSTVLEDLPPLKSTVQNILSQFP